MIMLTSLETLAEQSPLIAGMIIVISAMVYAIHFLYKIIQKKDKQLLSLAESNIKIASMYEEKISRSNEIQSQNSKDHNDILDLIKASYVIIKDLKQKLL